ncbi:MAG: hypothetical protein DWQ37_18605 [Planctomycetota bacterium]|nr:MAG: hypothetical protein DWQ37_18605 [Planctomycetota bacterium]
MTRKWISFAIIALLASPAAAGETYRVEKGGRGLTRVLPDNRTVRVVRDEPEVIEYDDEPELVQHHQPMPADKSEAPSVEDFNNDDWIEEWETGGSCSSGECEVYYDECVEPCTDCGMMDCCCIPYWAHRSYVYGEYLYLLPTDVDMAHAFQQNGTGGLGTVPLGQTGVVQPDFNSAYRTGFGVALGCYASIGASYTNFHSHATDQLNALTGLGDNVQSLVLHPNSINAGSTFTEATAALDIDYQLADIDYRRLLSYNDCHFINYAAGVRYGKLSQDFIQIGELAPPTGTLQTTSYIDFEGVGLRAGLDGEHRLGRSRLAAYGKGFINVLFGEFRSAYQQLDTTTTDIQALSTWNDRRVVPMLEYEVGMSWTSCRGHWRLSAGYYTSFWFNTITTQQFVQAVQNADFVDLGETMSFTGLVSRVEFRF